jgi:riboflavin kinase
LVSSVGGGVGPSLWFTLLELARLGCLRGAVRVSTTELAARLGCSQQSASRHLRALEGAGLVSRRIGSDGSLIRVTGEGRAALEAVYAVLRGELEGAEGEVFEFEGTVFSGMYQGGYYITRPGYRDQIVERLGFDPYPGTLNLRIGEADLEQRRRLDVLPGVHLDGFRDSDRAFGGARCIPLLVNGEVEGALIVAERTSYDLSVMEVISPVGLRERFGLEDGDTVRVTFVGRLASDTQS